MFLRKAVTLIRNVIVGGSDKSYQTCSFECDTSSDLPAQDQTTYMIDIGSTAHDIDQNAEYCMQSDGTWVLQVAGTAAYTKAETDTLLAAKADAATTYTKTETDNLLAPKITLADVYGLGTALTTGTDLDTFNSNSYLGSYYTANSSIAASCLNRPNYLNATSKGFRLEVKTGTGNTRIIHDMIVIQTSGANIGTIERFMRCFTSAGWGDWYQLNTNIIV